MTDELEVDIDLDNNVTMVPRERHEYGWWGMACWNGLSAEQQRRLIEVGNLEFGYTPKGECMNGADLTIEARDDDAPGPRFYCLPCGLAYLQEAFDHGR